MSDYTPYIRYDQIDLFTTITIHTHIWSMCVRGFVGTYLKSGIAGIEEYAFLGYVKLLKSS